MGTCKRCGALGVWLDRDDRCWRCTEDPSRRDDPAGPTLTERLEAAHPRADWPGDTWGHTPGRGITFNGVRVAVLTREGNSRDGWAISPHEADLLLRYVVVALNSHERADR